MTEHVEIQVFEPKIGLDASVSDEVTRFLS